jgi:SAM-dependent methyltransferase
MDDFGPGSYGDAFADVYDQWYPDVTDLDACVARVADLARDATAGRGSVLELGVGTGRLALPLAELGLAVTGVDASAAMLERVATKPGAARLRVVAGDMADLDASDLDGGGARDGFGPPFQVVLIAYNTLFNLADDLAQARCLTGAAARLAPAGRLVIETFVPAEETDPDDPGRPTPAALSVSRVTESEVVLNASVHDAAAQTVVGQHIQLTSSGTRLRPWRIHYLHPDQLDALARRAGLVPLERWRDWHGTAFDDDSQTLISVYGLIPVDGPIPVVGS